MKISHILLSATCFVFLAVASCQKDSGENKPTPKAIKVESVTLNSQSLTMVEGDVQSLVATIYPSDASNKKVTWSTNNSSVATVNDKGTVTAVSSGSATITVTTDDGGKTANCSVSVCAKISPVTSIELDKTSVTLKVGQTVTLKATVKPDDATDKTVTWSSSDESIATVADGVVTAKKVGKATVTAKAGDKTATCAITVEATPVTSIELDKTSASMKVGQTVTLKATVKPDDATDKTVIWSTTDATVVTVSNGVVTAKKVGTATIKAKAGEQTATCTIIVVGIIPDGSGDDFIWGN